MRFQLGEFYELDDAIKGYFLEHPTYVWVFDDLASQLRFLNGFGEPIFKNIGRGFYPGYTNPGAAN